MRRKPKYTSMQEELAARKRAGEFGGEETRMDSHAFEVHKKKIPAFAGKPSFSIKKEKKSGAPVESIEVLGSGEPAEKEKGGLFTDTDQKDTGKVIAYTMIGVVVGIMLLTMFFTGDFDETEEDLVWSGEGPYAESHGLSVDSTPQEVEDFIVQITEYDEVAEDDELENWSRGIPDLLKEVNVGEYSSYVTQGRLIILTEIDPDDSAGDVLNRWTEASGLMLDGLNDEGLDMVYVSVVARDKETGELRLIMIDEEVYYASGSLADAIMELGEWDIG